MNTQTLCHTLQQLHVKICDRRTDLPPRFPDANEWSRMEVLHTFTFTKSFNWHFDREWFLLDLLTSCDVMPLLRRMNFCIVIDMNDFDRMYQSALFTDHRHVDVHYALLINDHRDHFQLINRARHFNRCHMISATFISEYLPAEHLRKPYDYDYVSPHCTNVGNHTKDQFFSSII